MQSRIAAITLLSLGITLGQAFAPRLAAAYGHIDPAFNRNVAGSPSGPDQRVLALAVAPDDSVLIAGNFLNVGIHPSPAIARLKPDGSPDPTFHSPFSTNDHLSLTAIALATEGKFVIAGPGLVSRLLADGTLDPSFKAAEDAAPMDPTCVAVDADGRVLVGSSSSNPPSLVRLLPDGTVDPGFVSGYGAAVRAVLPLPEGGVMVAGMGGLVRLLGSGALDPAFTSTTDGPAYAMDRLPDGRIVISGMFQSVGKVPRSGIARLLADGTVDPLFEPTPNINYPMEHVVALPDGTAMFSGAYGTMRPFHVKNDGQQDWDYLAFVGEPNNPVYALGRQSTGAIVCAGEFTWWDLVPRTRLARLIPDGLFNPGFLAFRAVEPDGGVVFEGTPSVHRTLYRSGGTDGAVSVWVADRPGTYGTPATNGVDYTFVPHRVEFADGQSEATVEIAITDDQIPEDRRSLVLFLSEPAGGADLGIAATAVTIYDNDAGAALAITTPVVSEVSGIAAIQLQRVGAQFIPFAVDVEFIPGTARPGIDYVPILTHVVFGANNDTANATVRILDNGAADGPRQFGIRLHAANGTNTVGQPSEGVVTIRDNERAGGVNPAFPGLPKRTAYQAFQALPDGSAIVVTSDYRLVKLTPAFKEDPAFHAAVHRVGATTNNPTAAVGVSDDGRILVLDTTGDLNGPPYPLVRLLADGSRDPAFPTNILVGRGNTSVFPRPDGSFYIASDTIAAGAVTRSGLVRFRADGTLDRTFAPGVFPTGINALLVDPLGRITIAGRLSGNPKDPAGYVTRLLHNGDADPGFHATGKAFVHSIGSYASSIEALLRAPDGSLYVGGTFDKFGDVDAASLVRLTRDGDLDPSFEPLGWPKFGYATRNITRLALQSNGRLLVSGTFVRGAGSASGYQGSTPLVRLFPDGSLDPSFDAGVIGYRSSKVYLSGSLYMRILDDGELLVNGWFDTIDGADWFSIARLYLETPRSPTSGPMLSGSFDPTDRTVHLRVEYPVAGKFALEGSDTLGDWQTLSTHDLVPEVLEITDTPPPGTNARFYRLRSVP